MSFDSRLCVVMATVEAISASVAIGFRIPWLIVLIVQVPAVERGVPLEESVHSNDATISTK